MDRAFEEVRSLGASDATEEHREAIERVIVYADHLGLSPNDIHHFRQLLGDSTVDEEWQPIEFDPHPSDFLLE